MSIGEGILWSTIIIIVFVSIILITKNRRWMTFLKVFMALVIVGAVIGLAIWLYQKYEARPQVVTELSGISLGMREVDVTLIKGKPDKTIDARNRGEDDSRKILLYKLYGGDRIVVVLDGPEDQRVVNVICVRGGYEGVLGFNSYSYEKEIVETLGEPKTVSIDSAGTDKMISYPRWNAAFEITKGKVLEVCITDKDNGLVYTQEYSNTSKNKE